MERTALAAARIHTAPKAARKSEWLRSALAHHYCPDEGVDNEIVVLATGIDQYLQEVFHHLAFPSQEDSVSAGDFAALCAVLGLRGTEDATRTLKDEELRDVCAALPEQIPFKEFHSRLCGFFRARSSAQSAWRLPVSEDTELVERQIRLRWPRYRRRKCVSFDLTTRDQRGAVNRSTKHRTPEQVHEAEEVAALRELVEDLRSALQGSDARCLALEVALRRERSSRTTFPSGCKAVALESSDASEKLNPAPDGAQRDGAKEVERRWDVRDTRDPVLRELKLIRSSRDGQLEEAIKFNQRLEEELHWAYQEVRKLQRMESSLRKENIQIRRRAEEAREALRVGLQRVRLIQEQAQSVPQLQSRISQLETELQQYRGHNTCDAPVHSEDSCSQTVKHPSVLPPEAECLQRAVEGRAASDEEEDDRGVKEVKRHACRLLGCGKGCQNSAAHQSHLQEENSDHPHKDSTSCCRQIELLKKKPDVSLDKEKRSDRLQEKEKTRLEDKFRDSLSLLLQLHNKKASCRVLEKLVTDSLEVCSRSAGARSDACPCLRQFIRICLNPCSPSSTTACRTLTAHAGSRWPLHPPDLQQLDTGGCKDRRT
uniref:Uncharacterized protein n=1 Tax=Oryzias latipes TaxID=8090 RepID=A0A3P9IDA7_ORYLA